MPPPLRCRLAVWRGQIENFLKSRSCCGMGQSCQVSVIRKESAVFASSATLGVLAWVQLSTFHVMSLVLSHHLRLPRTLMGNLLRRITSAL